MTHDIGHSGFGRLLVGAICCAWCTSSRTDRIRDRMGKQWIKRGISGTMPSESAPRTAAFSDGSLQGNGDRESTVTRTGMADKELQIHVTNDPTYVENGCTVYFREGGPCWIIDPGLPPQAERIIRHVREKSLEPAAIVLTHAHADHIGGIDEVRATLGPLPVYLAKEEWPALTNPMENLSGLTGCGFTTQVRDPLDLPPGSVIELDGTRWEIRDTSGHSPGGRTLYCRELGIAFVGDALFAGSIGRVDFPHSHGDQLMRNIHQQLMTLPDETRVFSGHGPETTIGRERMTNPFILRGL